MSRIRYQCAVCGMLDHAVEVRGAPPRCPRCHRPVVLRIKG